MALTAAECCWNLRRGEGEVASHMNSLLSFPPEARCCPSYDHLSPHTCNLFLLVMQLFIRIQCYLVPLDDDLSVL